MGNIVFEFNKRKNILFYIIESNRFNLCNYSITTGKHNCIDPSSVLQPFAYSGKLFKIGTGIFRSNIR